MRSQLDTAILRLILVTILHGFMQINMRMGPKTEAALKTAS